MLSEFIRIVHEHFKILAGTSPKIIKGLQDTLIPFFQLGKTCFGDKKLIAALICLFALFAYAVFL